MGFNLSDWIAFYLYKMEPLVYTPSGTVQGVQKRYEVVNEILERPGNAAIRGKVFGGKRIIDDITPEYWMLTVMSSLNISPSEWESLSVQKCGQLVAYFQLKQMCDFLDGYERVMKSEKEAMMKSIADSAPSGKD